MPGMAGAMEQTPTRNHRLKSLFRLTTGQTSLGRQKQANAQATGYRLQATGYRLQATGYRLQATGYRLQATGYRLQATGYRLQDET